MDQATQIKDVATQGISVRPDSPWKESVEILAKHGAVVLIDLAGKPDKIMTSCDVEKVKAAVPKWKADSNATAKDVFSVASANRPDSARQDEDVVNVARKLRDLGFRTGISIVDEGGKFVGYAFSDKIAEALGKRVMSIGEQVSKEKSQLQRDFPEQWKVMRPFVDG